MAHIPRGSAVVCFSVSARQARVMSNGCCGVYRVVPSTREDKVGHAGISEDDSNRPIRSGPIIPLQRGHAGRIEECLWMLARQARSRRRGAEHAASRNGHPHLRLDPKSDVEAKALIERFDVEPAALPVVFCPGGQLFGLRLSDQRAPDLSHDRPAR